MHGGVKANRLEEERETGAPIMQKFHVFEDDPPDPNELQKKD